MSEPAPAAPRRLRVFFAGFFLGIVFTIIASLAALWLARDKIIALQSGKLRTPPITAGLRADYTWSLTAHGGGAVPFESLRGKTVFLNFWQPECTSCLAERPAINTLHAALAPEGVEFVCVAVSGLDKLDQTIAKYGITFPQFTLDGPRPPVFDATATPATYIIAPDGAIAFKHLGGAKWDDPAVLDFIRSLNAP